MASASRPAPRSAPTDRSLMGKLLALGVPSHGLDDTRADWAIHRRRFPAIVAFWRQPIAVVSCPVMKFNIDFYSRFMYWSDKPRRSREALRWDGPERRAV